MLRRHWTRKTDWCFYINTCPTPTAPPTPSSPPGLLIQFEQQTGALLAQPTGLWDQRRAPGAAKAKWRKKQRRSKTQQQRLKIRGWFILDDLPATMPNTTQRPESNGCFDERQTGRKKENEGEKKERKKKRKVWKEKWPKLYVRNNMKKWYKMSAWTYIRTAWQKPDYFPSLASWEDATFKLPAQSKLQCSLAQWLTLLVYLRTAAVALTTKGAGLSTPGFCRNLAVQDGS